MKGGIELTGNEESLSINELLKNSSAAAEMLNSLNTNVDDNRNVSFVALLSLMIYIGRLSSTIQEKPQMESMMVHCCWWHCIAP